MVLTLGLWLWLHPVADAGKQLTAHNHAEWRWRTLSTERFDVHYPVEHDRHPPMYAEDAARRIAAVADDVWLRMGEVLEWHPTERLTVVVVDDADTLKAWSWPLRGTVMVTAHPGTRLARQRGGGDALLDVFAHELAHVFTQKRMGAVSEASGFGLDTSAHAELGTVQVGARIEVSPRVPHWWSEGAAEYLASRVGYSWWTAERQTTLRQAVLEDTLLTWPQMQVSVGKSGPGDSELAYQQGHAFFRWLEERYGPDLFAELHAEAARVWRPNPSRVLRTVLGQSPEDLYDAFVESLRSGSVAAMAARPVPTAIEPLPGEGGWVLAHQRHPDRSWEGTVRGEYLQVRGVVDERLHERWFPTCLGTRYAFVPGADAVVACIPDEARGEWGDGYGRNALFRIDLTPRFAGTPEADLLGPLSSRIQRVPGSERALDVAASKTGRLAWVRAEGATAVLMVEQEAGKPERHTLPGAWMTGPSWSPDGQQVVVAAHAGWQTDLWALTVDSGEWRKLTDDASGPTDPVWTDDGVWYSADVVGFRDVFLLEPDTGTVRRRTVTLSGFDSPTVLSDGDLVVSAREHGGWRLVRIASDQLVDVSEPSLGRVEGGPRRTAVQAPAHSQVPDRSYHLVRDALPVVGAPALMVEVLPPATAGQEPGPDSLAAPAVGVMAGGWLVTRDPAELVLLQVYGMTGHAHTASGRLASAAAPIDLAVAGAWEHAPRPWATEGPAAVTLRTANWDADWWVRPERLLLGVQALTRHQQVRLDRTLPTQTDVLGSLHTQIGQGPVPRQLVWTGGVFTGRFTTGRSQVFAVPSTEDRGPVQPGVLPWLRGEVSWAQATSLGPLLWDTELEVGWIDRDVPPSLEFKAGGGIEGSRALGRIRPQADFPGFAPRAISGEQMALARTGLALPLENLSTSVGGLFVDGLSIRVGGQGGGAADATGSGPLLGSVSVDLSVLGAVADQPWTLDSGIAHGFGTPDPTQDWLDVPHVQGRLRGYLRLGAGW